VAEREVELLRELLASERERHAAALAAGEAEREWLAGLLKAALERPGWLERLIRALRRG
jgi:hypothetical protein